MSKYTKETVLVLNKCWQAIHVKSPEQAFGMMFSGVATGMDIQGMEHMVPYKWDDWVQLPIGPNDDYIETVRGKIKVPKVIVLAKFDKVPSKRPKFSNKAVFDRDGGICQYTGKKLKPNEGNIDHVIPRSKGGKTSFDNCVLSSKEINTKKADKTPKEAGLKLIKQPTVPKEMPVSKLIKNKHKIPEWDHFLEKQ